ncbi:hypothetical protein BKA62DRAFT_709996 [Auriculariales sp. MPI-PUGE-AT-0066]|nr:hypothetical protein BKA62DRAFT_709996 [Auriculariales sp. MPI-PUGE-AT-0066]
MSALALPRDTTSRTALTLPVEVAQQVFDYGDLDVDLWCASRVCAAWRVAALSHPAFWRHISVSFDEVQDKNSDVVRKRTGFFAARLAQVPATATNVEVKIRAKTHLTSTIGSDALSRVCSNALAPCIGNVRRLEVRYSDIVAVTALEVLSSSTGAPNLEHLEIETGVHFLKPYREVAVKINKSRKVWPWGRTLPTAIGGPGQLPSGLVRRYDDRVEQLPSVSNYYEQLLIPQSLNINCPNLKSLRLHHMELPDAPSQVFDMVEELAVLGCKGVALRSLPRRFPCLRRLIWEKGYPNDIPSSSITSEVRTWIHCLQRLGTDHRQFLDLVVPPSGARIPCVIVLGLHENTQGVFYEYVSRWAQSYVGDLALIVEQFPDDHYRPSVKRDTWVLSVTHVAHGASCGMRVHHTTNGVYEVWGGQSVRFTDFSFLSSRLVRIRAWVSRLQELMNSFGGLDKIRVLEVLMLESPDYRAFLSYRTSGYMSGLETLRFIACSNGAEEGSAPVSISLRNAQSAVALLVGDGQDFKTPVVIEFEGVTLEGTSTSRLTLTYEELNQRINFRLYPQRPLMAFK